MLADLAKAMAGMALVLGGWYAFQALVRRSAKTSGETDVLDHMAHGCCGGCSNRGRCKSSAERMEHKS